VKTRTVSPGRVAQAVEKIKMPVTGLQVGMYVCELDRPWLETPFLMQGFLIENLDDISVIQDICEYVYIEAVRDTYIPPEETLRLEKSNQSKPRYINKVSAQKEQQVAHGIYRHARQLTKSFMDEVRLGNSIDTEQAKEAVKDCVNSVLRNADALLWLSKIRHQDDYTAEHSLSVCILCVAFGRHLGLREEELQLLGLCGMLHDVGKMKTPSEILNKEGKLTEKEFAIMKAHTVHGRNILMSHSGLYHGTVDVAYSHHERIDGEGYPRGLKGAGIPYFAKIVGICDAYDAITSDRVYSKGQSSLEALKILYQNRGTQFDAELVIQFIQCIGLYPVGGIVELQSGEVAIILNTNYKDRRLPDVLLVLDNDKQAQPEPEVLHLMKLYRNEALGNRAIKAVLPSGSHGLKLSNFNSYLSDV